MCEYISQRPMKDYFLFFFFSRDSAPFFHNCLLNFSLLSFLVHAFFASFKRYFFFLCLFMPHKNDRIHKLICKLQWHCFIIALYNQPKCLKCLLFTRIGVKLDRVPGIRSSTLKCTIIFEWDLMCFDDTSVLSSYIK